MKKCYKKLLELEYLVSLQIFQGLKYNTDRVKQLSIHSIVILIFFKITLEDKRGLAVLM